MPTRDGENAPQTSRPKRQATAEQAPQKAPQAKEEAPVTGEALVRKKKERLTLLAGNHIGINSNIKTLTTQQDKGKKEIKELIGDKDIYEVNGKHKEITLPAGDGKTEYFVQLQTATSVGVVANIISLMRAKLGAKAETYITTQEVLHSNAIESMYNSGLITEKDVKDWTTEKDTERLIVQIKEKEKK